MQSSDIWQLTLGLMIVITALGSAVALENKTIAKIMLLLIPFQLIENKYGTSSIAAAYFIAVALYIKGWRLIPYPILTLGLLFAFVISFVFAKNNIAFYNAIYIVNFFASLTVFFIFFNYSHIFGEEASERLLFGLNILVIAYCTLQLFAGPGNAFRPFGMEAFEFHMNRGGGDPRLVGPFGAPGATATYLLLMTIVCVRAAHLNRTVSIIIPSTLFFLNLIAIALTGNRTAMLLAVAGSLAYIIVIATDLSLRVRLATAIGSLASVVLAVGVASYTTQFDVILDRLDDVAETRDGLPETRARVWAESLEKIIESPWTGDGPYLLYQERAEQLGLLRSNYDKFPHSLYLYLLRTVGVIGLLAFIVFFMGVARLIASDNRTLLSYRDNARRLRFLQFIVIVFLLNQITLEFMRIGYMDLSQFVFAILGIYSGALHQKRTDASVIRSATPQ